MNDKRKVTNSDVLAEILRGYYQQIKLEAGVASSYTSQCIKSRREKRKIRLEAIAKKAVEENIPKRKGILKELSFRTTFEDYKNFLFECNFMPTHNRVHPKYEDSAFSNENIFRFGTRLALASEIGIYSFLVTMAIAKQISIKYALSYLGLKILTNTASYFYEQFRKTKQRMESFDSLDEIE